MSWRRNIVGVAFTVSITTAWACSEEEKDPCPKDNPECAALSTVEDGATAVKKRDCVGCHGADMSGSLTPLGGIGKTVQGEDVELYPPNLTSDDTGVGKWTDDSLAFAIRNGVDAESQSLCPQMTHFSQMSDFEAYSIVKYLRSIPKVSKKVPRSVCPPTKTKEQQSSGG